MDRTRTSFQSIFSISAAGAADILRNIELKSEVKSEIIRKSIHFLIALTPFMASLNRPFTVLFLLSGTLGYVLLEYLRFSGVSIPIVSSITSIASRPRDNGRFIIGPVTLGLGALIVLILYPPVVATIAIYALAFGDGFASLIGRTFGKYRPAFLLGKSIEGSIACFTVVFTSAYIVTGQVNIAFVAALTAMAVEAMPLEDYDNIVIPVVVGFAVQFAYLFQY
jgi:dolichol kinase